MSDSHRSVHPDPGQAGSAPDDWPQLLEYLEACPNEVVALTKQPDSIDPSRTFHVPLGTAGDGVMKWSLATVYYLREHQVAPPDALVDHIRERDYKPPASD